MPSRTRFFILIFGIVISTIMLLFTIATLSYLEIQNEFICAAVASVYILLLGASVVIGFGGDD